MKKWIAGIDLQVAWNCSQHDLFYWITQENLNVYESATYKPIPVKEYLLRLQDNISKETKGRHKKRAEAAYIEAHEEIQNMLFECLFDVAEVEVFEKQHGIQNKKKTEHMQKTKGRGASDKNKALAEAIRHIFKTEPAYRGRPASAIKTHIAKIFTSDRPFKVNGGTLYADNDQILFECKGKTENISNDTFNKQVAKIKEELKKPAK